MFRIETTITEGTLTEGTFVRIRSVGTTKSGRTAWDGTSSGTFAGIYLDEGDEYAMFKDGEINGTPQSSHGVPLRHLLESGYSGPVPATHTEEFSL